MVTESTVALEAAEWLLRLDEEPNAKCRNSFAAWLKKSPQHMEEFLLVSAAAGTLRGIDAARTMDVEALLKKGLENVVPLNAAQPMNAATARGRWRLAAVATTIFLAAGLALLFGFDRHRYSTGLGEQRSFQMEDGSLLHLNTQSRVMVRYSKQAREIALLEGEALFVAAQDRSRPFRVTSGTTVIQAVGTEFNVYRRPHETIVSVIEGRVKVRPAGGLIETPLLAAGQQISLRDEAGSLSPVAADLDAALAWRQRRLVFRSQRLEDIAVEFNRYNRTAIRVEGTAGEKRMSGTFNANQPEAFLGFLARDAQLTVERSKGEVVVRQTATRATTAGTTTR